MRGIWRRIIGRITGANQRAAYQRAQEAELAAQADARQSIINLAHERWDNEDTQIQPTGLTPAQRARSGQ